MDILNRRICTLTVTLFLFLVGCAPVHPTSGSVQSAGGSTSEAGAVSLSSPNLIPADYPVRALQFTHLTSENGISQSVIHTILQDHYGFVWLGTEDGLNKFDGRDFTVYKRDPSSENTLGSNNISALAETGDGILWIGTENAGITSYDRDRGVFTQYHSKTQDPSSLCGEYILSLLPAPNGDLWIGTNGGGLCRFDRAESKFIRYQNNSKEPNSISSNQVVALAWGTGGVLWVGTVYGLNRFDPASGVFENFISNDKTPFVISRNTIHALLPDGNILWVGTEAGLYQLDPASGAGSEILASAGLSTLERVEVDSILKGTGGTIWVGTGGYGLFRISPDHSRVEQILANPRVESSLTDNRIMCLLEDASGILWLGTYSSYIDQLDPLRNRFFQMIYDPWSENNLSESLVWSLAADTSRRLWIGTDGGGLNRYDFATGKMIYYRSNPFDSKTLDNDYVRAVFIDRGGNVWVGTSSGLNLYNPTDETFEHIPLLVESKQNKPTGTEDMMPTQMTILVIRQDEEGLLWIGTVSNGLFRFNPTTREIKHYEFLQGYSNSLTSNLVWAIYPDGPQTIWIGTDRGMTRLDTKYNNFKNYMAENNIRGGLSDYRVLSLFRDNRGILWVGTGSGLNRYDPASDTFRAYHEKDGLPNDYVYAIVQDDENQLWLSTNKGISRFNPEKDNFINYDRKDGLTGDEFNQGSFARDTAGTIYFGGIDGITYFQPDQIRPNTWLPKTMLTSLTQGGLPMSGKRALETLDAIRLTWPKNYFEFTFRNLTSSQANEDLYAYKLIPFEKNWVPALKTGSGRYTNLPGGEYTLYIRGTNNEGVWGQEVPALKVVVIPPFWENRILLAFSLILAAMLVSSGVFLRIRSIEKHNRELSELVTARTREIDQRRQVAEGLREILVRINSNQPIEESLDLITGQGREVVHADLVLILSNCIVKSNAHRVFSQSNGDTDGTELTDQERVWLCEQNALSSGHTLIDPSTYPGMGTPRLKEFACGIVFPVVLESRVEAVLAVLTRREAIFSSDEIELLAACADQAALVMGNARLRQKAEDLAMLNERNRLARDLHDAVTQTLFSASLLAEALPSVWENNPQEGRKLTHEMRQLTRGALAEMRSLLMELRPSALAEAKLPDLLRQLTEAVVGRTGLDIHLEVQPDIYLPSEVNITLYRIAQEAMTNIVKHAHAGQVWIRCRKLASETGLQMQVEDDGCGFDLKAVSPDHFGLYNMRERAESVHARLEIASRIGRGTLLTVTWEGEENLNGG